jgi:hypothetical protein
MENEEPKRVAATYMPFKTFLTTLDHLKAHGVPNIIDRSVFPSSSGGVQSQIISGLHFLGLINEKGIPASSLHHLVEDADNRKANFKAILEEKYENLFRADLTRVTPSQFDVLFSPEIYGVNGDTRKKARAFFFAALAYVNQPHSKLLTQRTRSPRKKKVENGVGMVKPSNAPAQTNRETSGENELIKGKAIKSVILGHTGKYVWLGTDVNILELKKGRDRDFIFALSDLFDEYEAEKAAERYGENGAEM